ncbi:hypothetical protein RI367_003877 [Sorochytrium milnesiophthora]
MPSSRSLSSLATPAPPPQPRAQAKRRPQQQRKPAPTEAQKLAQENERMEERLMALKTSLARQKEKMRANRAASAGSAGRDPDGAAEPSSSSLWKSGRQGTLGSHAKQVLHQKNAILQSRGVKFDGVVQQAEAMYQQLVLSKHTTSSMPNPSISSAQNNAAAAAQAWSVPMGLDWRVDMQDERPAKPAAAQIHHDDRPITPSRITSYQSFYAVPAEALQSRMSSVVDPTKLLQELGDEDDSVQKRHPDLAAVRAPPGAETASLLDGAYDEQANRASFADALDAWRRAGKQQQQGQEPVVAPVAASSAASLLEGHYDEDANRADFARALQSWRHASNAPVAPPAVSSHTTQSDMTPTATQQAQPGDKSDPAVNFHTGVSYMQRLLIKKLRSQSESWTRPATPASEPDARTADSDGEDDVAAEVVEPTVLRLEEPDAAAVEVQVVIDNDAPASSSSIVLAPVVIQPDDDEDS